MKRDKKENRKNKTKTRACRRLRLETRKEKQNVVIEIEKISEIQANSSTSEIILRIT